MEQQPSTLPDEYVLSLAELELWGDATPEQSAMLRTDAMIEQWYHALGQLHRQIQSRCASLKNEASLKQQECWCKGPNGKPEWFAFSAKQRVKLNRETIMLKAVEMRLAEIKPRVKELHRQKSLEFIQTRVTANANQSSRGDSNAIGVVERLMRAITPLASLDYLLTSSVRDDTHLAAYKAVRLKVADIREARAAWLEAQTLIGSGTPQEDEQGA